MEKIKTNSHFVTVCKSRNKIFVQRKKRKGLHAYPRTLTLKEINKYLDNTKINYPKLLKNSFKYVNEEYIESTQNINSVSNSELMDKTIDIISKLNTIEINSKKITWNNNTEFLKYNIKNLKDVLINKKPIKLNEYILKLDDLYKELDNNRKLCFIHGDIHKNNMIINKDKLYLIDWELATYGDLAYELATHFILMEYNENEKKLFLEKLTNCICLDVKKLMKDIEVYIKFELYRRNILKEIKK